MGVLAVVGPPLLGWVVSQLLTEVIGIFRKLKNKDRNMLMLRDVLERLEPFVKQMTSLRDVEKHAGKSLTDLRDLLDEAKAFAESTGRRAHAGSIQDEASTQSSGPRTHDGITQAGTLPQSPGREFHRHSKRRKLQFWTTSWKALDLCKRIRHLLKEGTIIFFAYHANSEKKRTENAEKMLVKLEDMKRLLPFGENGVSEEKIRFGGDAIEAKIRENLLKGDDKWVGLWGMGGIGKTFTASSIYRDHEINEHFADGVFWITVSKDQADATHVCNTLLESLGVRHRSLKEAKSYLRKTFEGKTILMILDDVWEREPSEEKILQHLDVVSEVTKSVILVTTREKKTFPQEWKPKLFPIPILSPEDSWILFSWHAFGRHGRTVSGDLVSVARDVANECEGLPLALEVIGSTMADKEVSADEEYFDIKPLLGAGAQ